MRISPILFAALALAATPVVAQTPTPAKQPDPGKHHTGERPTDLGPTTPGANSAYQGGGVVLQGEPGAPPPKPQATAPGQPPQNAVPH